MLYGGTVGVKFAMSLLWPLMHMDELGSPLKKTVQPPLKGSYQTNFQKVVRKYVLRVVQKGSWMIHGLSEWGYDCGYSRDDIGVQIFSGHRILDTHLLQTLWRRPFLDFFKKKPLIAQVKSAREMSTIREKIPFYITWHVIKVGKNPSF